MDKNRHLQLTIIFLGILLLKGCGQAPPSPKTLSEAHQKFNKICTEEHNYKVVTKQVANTFWIYLPTEENIIDIKALKKGPTVTYDPEVANNTQYLMGDHQGETLKINYYVSNYKMCPGYSSDYSDSYKTKQRNFLSTIFRSFAGLDDVQEESNPKSITESQETLPEEPTPELTVESSETPHFIVMVVADVKTGLKATTTIYFPDLKRAMTDQFFQMEFSKRTLSKVTGATAIIEDGEGRDL